MHRLTPEIKRITLEYIYLTLEIAVLEKKIDHSPSLHNPLISIRKELRDIKKQMHNKGIKVKCNERKGMFVEYNVFVKNQGEGTLTFLIYALKTRIKERLNNRRIKTK